MLAIAGQTPGPNGRTCFDGKHGYPGGIPGGKMNKKMFFFLKNLTGTSANYL